MTIWVTFAATSFWRNWSERYSSVDRGSTASTTPWPGAVRKISTRSPQASELRLPRGTQVTISEPVSSTRYCRPKFPTIRPCRSGWRSLNFYSRTTPTAEDEVDPGNSNRQGRQGRKGKAVATNPVGHGLNGEHRNGMTAEKIRIFRDLVSPFPGVLGVPCGYRFPHK